MGLVASKLATKLLSVVTATTWLTKKPLCVRKLLSVVAATWLTKTPLPVTATGPSTHVVEVNFISMLRERYRGGHQLCPLLWSRTFTVDGLDWKVCVDLEGEEEGYMSVFVHLVTAGAVAWARIKIGLVDWTTGRRSDDGDDDDDDYPMLFDAGSSHCYNSGTVDLAWLEEVLRPAGSRYLRHDCLKIECVIDVCRGQLAFPDPPAPRSTPRDEEVAGELGSHEGADVLIHLVGVGDGGGEPISAHSSVLDAYAPRFLKKHNLGRRRRRNKTTATATEAAASTAATAAMRVNVDDMPRPAVEALLRFIYTGTLPVVDGMSADGYRAMFWHLRRAGERYGMRRLSAICDRFLCISVDVDSAAASLAMAHRCGFPEIKKACLEFASDPANYGFVKATKGYSELMRLEDLSLVEELQAQYTARRSSRIPLSPLAP